jgi:hypothetical protein
METVRLWRPVGENELALIEESGFRRFPPRLDWQPIFYPVLSEDYATRIACDWNTKDGGTGYVTSFEVDAGFIAGTSRTRRVAASCPSTGSPPRTSRRSMEPSSVRSRS